MNIHVYLDNERFQIRKERPAMCKKCFQLEIQKVLSLGRGLQEMGPYNGEEHICRKKMFLTL